LLHSSAPRIADNSAEQHSNLARRASELPHWLRIVPPHYPYSHKHKQHRTRPPSASAWHRGFTGQRVHPLITSGQTSKQDVRH
jgi:hypothetical protein